MKLGRALATGVAEESRETEVVQEIDIQDGQDIQNTRVPQESEAAVAEEVPVAR
ncbi:hypothetical protein AB0K80_09180 [Streptomyces sp. NPDC052682]|uniref:hypothetical protein n=1 Tax=Streptomyces sp. NPDC052682 TaxID=3154954 RepID=UPI003431A748